MLRLSNSDSFLNYCISEIGYIDIDCLIALDLYWYESIWVIDATPDPSAFTLSLVVLGLAALALIIAFTIKSRRK